MRAALLLCALVAAGCFHPVAERCGACVVLHGPKPRVPDKLRAGTRTLFIVVPGVLGYGWEWDDAVAALRAAPATDFVVFEWDPWRSLRGAAEDLARIVGLAFWSYGRVERVVVVGHSVGGMVAALALGASWVPPGRTLDVISIGAPFAGMKGAPGTLDDPWGSPAMIAVMGSFARYPTPPKGARVTAWVTSWPGDPVMQPRNGHLPNDPAVGPPGMKRIAVAPGADHNRLVGAVVRALLTSSPPASSAPAASPR